MQLPTMRVSALILVVVALGACASPAQRGAVRTHSGAAAPLANACGAAGVADGDLIAALITAEDAAYAYPVQSAPVSSPFGPRWGRMHSGVDFDADYGAEVYAARGGVVSFLGRRGGYGRMVEISHADGATTRYAHLSAFGAGLAEGDRVGVGQMIGNVGASGRAFGAHLHFEIRVAGEAIDPLPRLTDSPTPCREVYVSARPE